MKLGLLINYRDFFNKLKCYSFDSVIKNLNVIRYIGRLNEYYDFYSGELSKILKQYGALNEDGTYVIKSEFEDDANKEFEKLLNFSVDDMPKFPITDKDFETCIEPTDKEERLTIKDMMFLEELRRNNLRTNS